MGGLETTTNRACTYTLKYVFWMSGYVFGVSGLVFWVYGPLRIGMDYHGLVWISMDGHGVALL